jgi:hypothetical protein
MNSIRKDFKPQTLLPRDTAGNTVNNKEMVKQRWSEYYEKQFELQDRIDNDGGEEWTTCIQTAEYVEPSNGVDIEMTIRKLKKRKATGHDQILAELIKEGGKELKKVIFELI